MPKNDNLSQVSGHENLQIFRFSGKPLKMMKITTSWPQDPFNVHICWFVWEKCKNVKCPKMTFSSQVRCHENLQIFRLSGKPLKWWKSPPVDNRTLEMCIFADLGEKYAKMWNAQIWHFSHRSADMKIFKFLIFWKAFKNDENHHQLTTGPLKFAYLLIWVRNMQKCEMPKNDIFLAGPWSWKSSNFSTFWKAFKNDENHHQLTTGPLKCAYLLIWVRNMQKCEMPKNDIFLAGPRSWKSSIFFDFLESLLKWWKSPPVDHRTLEMCIFADLGEKYANMWNAQKWQFVASPRSWKSSNFSTLWKAFKNDENHHQLTTGPLKCAYLLIWVRNMQKCEMPKNDIFLAGPRSWKSFKFFDFLESL